MNGTIKIKGGNPLNGTITPVANKNAILPAIAASVLTRQTVTYKNVPKSPDVKILLEIISKLGGTVDDSDYNNLKITCKNINSHVIDPELGGKLRSSLFLAGSLLARVGKVCIPTPGGCVLGLRSMAAHIDSFKKVGVKVETNGDSILLTAPSKPKESYRVWQIEASVTGTENLFLYLAGTNTIARVIDCASEPHVKNLCEMLASMGANIKGIGSNKVTISGIKELKGTTFTPYPDHIDIATIITAAAITKGSVTIKKAGEPYIVDGLLDVFSKFNVNVKRQGDDLVVNQTEEIKLLNVDTQWPIAAENLPKFSPRPWPGFAVDSLPQIVTLMTKTKGKLLINNWMYENGLDFANVLVKMGANIYVVDPHRIIVQGPCTYSGGEVTAPGIIQATMAIFLAGLSDKGTTVMHGADAIKRRYPEYIEIYKRLGADIEEVK
jgi:UDP-N-acetylglucosamine 1-carboxyvinyltransferase